jgi:hypothetical protein
MTYAGLNFHNWLKFICLRPFRALFLFYNPQGALPLAIAICLSGKIKANGL